MKRVKLSVLGLMIIILGVASFLVVRQGKLLRPLKPVKPLSASSADMGLKEVRLTEVKAGNRQWEIKAKSAQYFKDKNLALLTEVEAVFFAKDGRQFSVRGDSARFNTDTKEVQIEGNIVAKSSEGYELRTNSVKYSQDSHRISTSDEVAISSSTLALSGKGMVIDLDGEKFYLLGGVQARQVR